MSVETMDESSSASTSAPIEAMKIDKDSTNMSSTTTKSSESMTEHEDDDTQIVEAQKSESNGHTDATLNDDDATHTNPKSDDLETENRDIENIINGGTHDEDGDALIVNGDDSNNATAQTTKKERKVRKIGYDSDGFLMPGFEDVNDDELAFSSESDFAIFIKQISSEIPLQRLVAVKRMMKSCKLWGIEAVLSVLPRVKQLSCDKEMVIRQAIAEVLGPFAKYLIETDDDETDVAHAVIINELLPLIKEMLMDAMEVRQGAGSSLIIIAELLNKEQVYEHILKIVLHMAHDDSDDQKITALPLLGDLAPIVGAAVCRNYLSADLHALSQDNSFRVRKATVQYFGPICSQLSCDECSECLLPIFLHLCSDSIWSVRKGCVESFVDVSCAIAPSERVQLIPIMEKFLNDSSRWVRNTAYEILGPFISTLNSAQISADFLSYFTSIPHLSSAEADADCTNHCAFNFPAVVLTVGKERWTELADTYAILCRKTFKSRKTLACSIHEIASVLGEELTEKYLLNSIEFFLKDIDDIRCGIIRNLWKILSVFTEKLRCEYISILWELASESDVNWRFRLLLAQQLDEIFYLYPHDMIQQQLIPLIFQLCQDRMADVRHAAVYPIADAINILHDDADHDDIAERIGAIYRGRTYSKRLLYIRIAESCFDRIDHQIFDDIFLSDLCAYHQDKIFNVRFCLARFIHDKLLKHERYQKHEQIDAVIEQLKNEQDDIEIKRFFCDEDDIEQWLERKKKEAAEREEEQLNNDENNKNLLNTINISTAGESDDDAAEDEANRIESSAAAADAQQNGADDNNSPDSTDSSLYSSSGSDNDDDDDSLNDDDDDSLSDDDDDDVLGDQLQQINDNLNSIKTESMNQEKEIQEMEEVQEAMEQGLVHQDTPYQLNIAKEINEQDDIQKVSDELLYGMKKSEAIAVLNNDDENDDDDGDVDDDENDKLDENNNEKSEIE